MNLSFGRGGVGGGGGGGGGGRGTGRVVCERHGVAVEVLAGRLRVNVWRSHTGGSECRVVSGPPTSRGGPTIQASFCHPGSTRR